MTKNDPAKEPHKTGLLNKISGVWGISRRRIMQGSLAAAVLAWAPAALGKRKAKKGRKKWPSPPKRRKARHHKKARWQKTSLAPGFYKHKKSKVIHYVSKKKVIVGVDEINEKRLQSLSVSQLLKEAKSGAKTHVHYSVASRAFEDAALDSIKAKRYAEACQLLELAINHDQKYKANIYRRPSLRLYDLFALVVTRFDQKSYSSKFTALSNAANRQMQRAPRVKRGKVKSTKAKHAPRDHRKQKLASKKARILYATKTRKALFTKRLKKWASASDSWTKRWKNTKTKNTWNGVKL